MTKTYRATALVIPISTESGGISSLLGGFSLKVFEGNVIIPEVYRVILNSNTIKDSLIKKFDLFEVYGAKYREHVYKKINQNILIEVEKELGFGYSPIIGIKVSVVDESPERSSLMANYYIEYLRNRVDELNLSYVNKKYEFIKDRYNESETELETSENNLKYFQDKYGLIEITEQFKLIFQNLAKLEAAREELEIEISVLEASIGTKSTVYQKLTNNVEALNKKIRELREGTLTEETQDRLFFPQKVLPELALKYYRLYREVEVQAKIYEMIKLQFEQVELQVKKDLPSLLALDYARVPTYKYKPKRLFVVLSGLLFSLFISVLYIFLKEYYQTEKLKNSNKYHQISEMKELLLSDFRRKKRK
jgi:uncharacterized protein involved in exopolysaccharide biosynthesis